MANHSPPTVMKPPRNRARIISRPADANLRALSSRSRMYAMVPAVSRTAEIASHTMIAT